MNAEPKPMAAAAEARIPVFRFDSAAEASRRIAGISVAGRLVQAAAAAESDAVILALPAGAALSPAAAADVARLAGGSECRILIGDGGLPGSGLVLPASRLLAPADLRAVLDDPSRLDWLPVLRLDAPGAAAAILRGTGKPGDGPVSRWLNRPLSRRLSALLLLLPGLRPIHASLGTLALAAAMLAFFVFGGEGGLLVAGLLFHAASVFDGVDGEVARATFQSSRSGASLDTAIDLATNIAFFGGLAFNLVARGEPGAVLVSLWGLGIFLPGIALIACMALRNGRPFDLDLVKRDVEHRHVGPLSSFLLRAATIISSRDFFALFAAFWLVLGQAMLVLTLFAATASVWIVFVMGAVLARARRGEGAAPYLLPAAAAQDLPAGS